MIDSSAVDRECEVVMPQEPKPHVSLPMAASFVAKRGVQPLGLEKVNIRMLSNINDLLIDMMTHQNLNPENETDLYNFLSAIVADIYVNTYNQEKSFRGSIWVNNFQLRRENIREYLDGANNRHRRIPYDGFARSMAKTVIEVMTNNELFKDIIQKRADELGISYAEAIKVFDGAEGAVIGLEGELNLAKFRKRHQIKGHSKKPSVIFLNKIFHCTKTPPLGISALVVLGVVFCVVPGLLEVLLLLFTLRP
ncbi:hypothetical protein O181_032314 [Austropuccinia psidii MF-1]|uniref:Uncharacterized protein n=1 Tax=Austropuccinia psidii MF-1 TaxID=1389203 RepID=A0A9Q3CWJ9_9BASI|nr:hypothetical protein [Austropuccinia psidii MF-1]